jgi:hypothetical protein
MSRGEAGYGNEPEGDRDDGNGGTHGEETLEQEAAVWAF